MNQFIRKTGLLSLSLLWLVASKARAADIKPLMLDKGPVIFAEDFSEPLDPKEWNISRGTWSVVNGALKGSELASDDHAAFIYKLAPLRNVVIQFSFRFDGSTQIGLSTNHNERGGHNSRVMITRSGFTMIKDTNLSDPADSGTMLGQCAYTFEPGQWYTMLVEYHGDEMLARINDDAFILGANSYLDQTRVSIRFPLRGSSASFDNVTAWTGSLQSNWADRRMALRKIQDSRSYADPKTALEVRVATLRADLLKQDTQFQALAAQTAAISLQLREKYPEASVRSSSGKEKSKRLLAEDPAFKALHENLASAQQAESHYLQQKDPRLDNMRKQVNSARNIH